MEPQKHNPKKIKHRMGYKRDPPHADGPLLMRPEDVAKLPPSYLIQDNTPVEDQEQLGSCPANAADNASKIRADVVTDNYFNGSRLATYYYARQHEGTLDEDCSHGDPNHKIGDCGCQVSSVTWVLENIGIAPETLWPYDMSKYNTPPPDSYMQQAAKDKTTKATRLDGKDENRTIANIKAALVNNYPVMFGFSCYPEINGVGPDGNVPMPTAGEQQEGGHATCIIGYDDNHQNPNGSSGAVLFKNSWGLVGAAKRTEHLQTAVLMVVMPGYLTRISSTLTTTWAIVGRS